MKTFVKLVLSIICGLFINVIGFAAVTQPVCRVRTYNVHDGLPSNNISRMAQDGQGLLWIGTWNGIACFDGYRFATFKSGDTHGVLTTNRVTHLDPDSNGHVWFFAYDRSPYFLDTKLAKFVSIKEMMGEKLPSGYTTHGFFNSSDHTWVLGDNDFPTLRVETSGPVAADAVATVTPSEAFPGARRIRGIVAGPDGSDWIVTDAGATLYGTDIRLKGHISSMALLDDITFFATEAGAIYMHCNGEKSVRTMPGVPSVAKVNDLLAHGHLLLASTEAGVEIYNTKTGRWTHLHTPAAAGSAAAEVVNMDIDSAGRLWAVSRGGDVYLMDPVAGTVKKIPMQSGLKGTVSQNHIWTQDPFGVVWIAPENGTFAYYNETSGLLVPYELRDGSSQRPVQKIERHYVDSQGNLWLSTTHDLTRVAFLNRNFKSAPLTGHEEVRSLLAEPDGSVLVGTYNGVLGRYSSGGKVLGYYTLQGDPDKGARIVTSDGTVRFSNRIYALFRDSRGRIWVGTKGEGVFTIHPDGTVNQYRHDRLNPTSLACDTVYGFDEDDRGNLWVGSYGGGVLLVREDASGKISFLGPRNHFKSYPLKDFGRVRRITHTAGGVIAVSCTDGLLTFSNRYSDPAEIPFYTTGHIPGDTTSLRTSNVMQTLITSKGNVYVATMGGGVQRLKGSDLLSHNLEFSNVGVGLYPLLNTDDHPGDGNVLSMIEDGEGRLYLVRETGIARVNLSDGVISVLSPHWAGENMEFTEAAPVCDAVNGTLWFGTAGGALVLNPADLLSKSYVPPIVFTGVQFQGESDRHKLINPECVEISPDRRNFSLSFAALDYQNNDLIQYAYRLDKDADWTYVGTSNTLQFTKLSPGIHRLYLKSTDNTGVWCDNERYIDIMVNPTFSESIWGKFLYVLIAMLVLGAIAYIYVQRRENQMYRDLHERERDFFIDASHRLRTPLTLISAPVNEVLNNEQLTPTGRMHLEKVHRNSQQMLSMVNTMLSLRSGATDYITDETVPDLSAAAPTTPLHGVSERTVSGPEPEHVSDPSDSRTKLLVVEDNDDLRSFLYDILSAEYHVICASNGKDGLEKAEHEQPDFIITDVTMPEMDGLTMVHNIKRQKALSHIPIIVLSAKASLSDRVEGLSAGIDDYITKPFSATYLRQRIANIISQRKLLQQNVFEQIGRELQSSATSQLPASEITTGPQSGPSAAAVAPAPAAAPVAPAGENTAPQQPEPDKSAARPEYRLGSPQIADADQEMMEKLLKFMEERISDEDLKIEELAEAVNMGRTVFYGKIKALVGMSPSDFLRRLRMQRAEELIVRSKMNFSQIAFNVGFSDPKYFTKCFKKETGMTPSEYRHKSQHPAAEPTDSSEPDTPQA